MWGGVVESERGGSSTAATAWGTNVAEASSTDSTSTWMGTGSGNQSGWGNNTSGTTLSKSGWDSAQQQSNLVGGHSGSGGWQAGSNSVNGWTGTTGGNQTNWNTGSGQQWTGTSPGGGSTWAGVAGRNAHSMSAQPNVQQGPAANIAPAVTTPTAVAVRPKQAAVSGGFDSGAVGWGKPIDQGTPWETRQGDTNTNTFAGTQSSATATPQWAPNSGANSGGSTWNNGGGNGSQRESWQNQSSNSRDGTPSFGGGYGSGKSARGGSGAENENWGAPQTGLWDSAQGQRHSSTGGNTWGNAGGVEQSQQRDGTGNVWTGPPAQQDSGDMVWTNPYPKKTAQLDKGTSTWGDPSTQGEIKRWKTNTEGDILPSLTALQGSAIGNAQQTQSGVGTGSGSGIHQAQQQQPTPTSPAWKDSQTLNSQQPSWNTSGLGDNIGQSNQVSSPNASNGGWSDSTTHRSLGGPTLKPAANDPDGIQAAGWGSNTKPNDASRNSTESDGGNNSDDVFSNPTTPMSAGMSLDQPVILSKQQQQMPNGFGSHIGAAGNLDLSQLQVASKLAAQSSQMQNLPFNNTTDANNLSAGRPQQQMMITQQQITNQLKAALESGLIDIKLLHQPLPQKAIVLLNQFLQCVPKLEQAQKEMQQLHAQASKQPQGPNAAQQQEMQRINNEIKQLQQNMTTLKQIIVSSQAQVVANLNQRATRNGTNAGGESGQSKLEQWKRGSTSGAVHGNDAGMGGGAGVFGGFSGNANDPWSNTPAKRNSGADWPQSAATTPGDMPKSPDKQNDGNDNQQSGEKGNRMSTPVSGAGNDASGTGGLVTPTLLDDVPEFKPGQPWNWRDPKELAEDPDATPGSVKRPALISVNSVTNPADIFGIGTSPSSIGGSTPGGNTGADMVSAGINAMNLGSGNNSMMPGGGGGYLNFGNFHSNFYGQTKPTSTGFDASKMPTATGFPQQQHGGLGDGWPNRSSRPPSQMGQPIGGRAQFKHSMSTPNTSGAGFMPPYNMGPSGPSQWVVLTNLNMTDEPTLQMMMSRVAPLTSCISPPGTGFAVVKFKDVSLDKILPRLQQECSAVGITIQLAKDEEVNRLMQAVSGHRGNGPQGAAAGHMFGPPPPPPHHPGPMGPPALWDAPPPQAGALWGAPPPSQAPGLHHHATAGPYAPHHAAALTDPAVAAAAISMGMAPGMHDGLFGSMHDRHPPF